MWIDFVLGLLSAIAMLIVGGMYIGSRRELLWTLRDRAERAEDEQALRVEQGRLNERTRIAREMHDVLAHRISLIAMHAGALAYRTDLTADETRETAELIQATSHEALTDLRQVLGVLRDGEAGAVGERPQPTFGDLSALVLEAEGAGMQHPVRRPRARLDRDAGPGRPDGVPDRPGRADQRAQARARGDRRGADDRLARPRESASGSATPRAARTPSAACRRREPVSGLVGLGERAKLAGGQPDHASRRRVVRAHRVAAVDGREHRPTPIRVLVVDDDALVRSGLVMILGGAPDIELVGQAVDGRDGVEAARRHRPDVVLMDIRMPRDGRPGGHRGHRLVGRTRPR